jgi:hypothetical protein
MEFSGNVADFYQFILTFIPISSCFFLPIAGSACFGVG